MDMEIWNNLFFSLGEEGLENGPIFQTNDTHRTKMLSFAHFNKEAPAA
jgi:hypothetical protein